MRRPALLLVLALVAGCSAAPTPTPFEVPTLAVPSAVASQVPIPTLLPTTTPEPATPSATVTPTATSAPTRVAATAVQAQFKFLPPVAVSPVRPETHKDGEDLIFRFVAVGKLAANQCYLVHVEMVNPNIHPGGNFGDDWLDTAHCGDTSSGDKELTFALYRGTFHNVPNYGTIESQATRGNQPTEMLKVTWNVRVVQNNGLSADGVHYQVVPLSLPSSTLDFDFRP